ncbi:MAG: hypothetical protein NT141_03190 [candidate division WWE3 bacterium]|nr:hypothetical protein [candidate division WWE3 bacterium]
MTLKIPGNTRLVGEVTPTGSVFSAITLACASVLFSDEVILENVPQVSAFIKFLSNLKIQGTSFSWIGKNALSLSTPTIISSEILDSIMVPVMLARFGEFKIPKTLVSNVLISWLKALNVELLITSDVIGGKLSTPRPLNLNLENSLEISLASLLLAVKISEESTFTNFLITEETLDLIAFLRSSGITVIEDPKIAGNLKVTGATTLEKSSFTLSASSFEAGFWLAASILSCGDIKIINAPKERLISLLSKLTTMQATFDFSGNSLRIWREPSHKLLPLDIEINKTQFLYDFLPVLVPILLTASGTSKIIGVDLVEELATSDLNLFNAKISDNEIIGPASLKGSKVAITNFYNGVSVLLVALGSGSRSEILESESILDYFDGLEAKLKSLYSS